MEMEFESLLEKFVLVYLDDITVHLKNATYQFGHLRQVFIKCREFDVSVNPRKCDFATNRGKFLGHIVSGDG